MKILVVGCGRIGAPLLTWVAACNRDNSDVEIMGVDVNPEILGPVKARWKEHGWGVCLQNLQEKDKVPNIVNYSDVYYPQDVIIITCGTPIDRNQNPDTRQVFSAIDSLANVGAISDDTLIIMRSTLFPGCSRLIRGRLHKHYGLFPSVVMAPERIAEGWTFNEISKIPQIIGADTDEDYIKAENFFNHFFGSEDIQRLTVNEGGTVAAEMAKLFCNTYRYVNFALGNEFAVICDENNVDYEAVRRACNERYWRCDIDGAALNLGGPCLGKDAKTLSAFTKNAKITESAYDVAEKTIMYYVDKYKTDILDIRAVGILGLAFKANSDNNMNSLSYKLIRRLEILGVHIFVHDPYIKHKQSADRNTVASLPIVFIMTEHDEYQHLIFHPEQIVIRL